MAYLYSFEKKRLRIFLIISLVVLFVLGVLTKEYVGPHRHWFKNYCGDMVFVMFLYFFVKLLKPYMHAITLGMASFATVSLIEFTQKVSYPWLDDFRATFWGQLILGQHFDKKDFIYYGLGTLLAMAIYSIVFFLLKQRRPVQSNTHGEQMTFEF